MPRDRGRPPFYSTYDLFRPTPKTMADLEGLAYSHPAARAVLITWRDGGYPSLEAALIHLACHLVEQNRQLTEEMTGHRLGALDRQRKRWEAVFRGGSVVAADGGPPTRDGEPVYYKPAEPGPDHVVGGKAKDE